jgi:hypothetical protein
MFLEDAFDIFSITSGKEISLDNLKKKYYKLALQYHPDKHQNSQESTEYFQKITEAYELLKTEISDNIQEEKEDIYTYSSFLQLFLNKTPFLSSIIHYILKNYENITIQIFEGIDKNTAINVYNFLLKHKLILHISDELIDNVKNIILDKYKDIYILIPSLQELFGERIFKLNIQEKIYYVPLWHSELEIEENIIVKCIPSLPENIVIDENNNIIFHLTININNLFDISHISIINDLKLPLHELKLKKKQYYTFRGKGIPRIKEDEILNVTEKGDIIVLIDIK